MDARTSHTLDIPLFSNVSPGGGSKHIRSNGRYSVFITHIVGSGNNAQAWCYTDSGLTNALTLTNILFDIGLQIDHTVKSNTLVLCGADPFGGNGSVYEYELGNQSPLPASITLTTNFEVGPGSTEANVTLLSNGGIAAMLTVSNPYTNQAFSVAYRRPSGVWKTYGVIVPETNDFLLSPALPTRFCSAEMPGDSSLFTLQSRDSAGWILAAIWDFTSTDLVMRKGFRLVDNHTVNGTNVWGPQSPYGEFPAMESLSDKSTNRILYGYFSDIGYSGPVDQRVGTEVLCAITADTNHYLLATSVVTTHKGLPCSLCWNNSTVTFGYAFCTSLETEPLNGQPLPYQLQKIRNGQPSAPPISPFVDYAGGTGAGGVLYRNDALDFVNQSSAGGVWHILRLSQ